MDIDIDRVIQYLGRLQASITGELQEIDGKAEFEVDQWQRFSFRQDRPNLLPLFGRRIDTRRIVATAM